MKKRIGIQGSLVFLALLFSILLSRFLFPRRGGALELFLDAAGMTMVLSGFLFRITARGYKSERSDNGKRLVTDGPYRLVRNPMYFGTLLIGAGVILALFNWWVFFIFLAGFLLIYIPQVKKEEQELLGRFGDGYKEYSRKTPKYFPRSFRLFNEAAAGGLFFRWSWLKKELPSLTAVLAAIIAAKIWLAGPR